ncbi:hypothetical protein CPB84DRAFT_1853572 [Gymnopilus junonius]|uniref:Uncharacterized protein n=1 Tax=Gymnopilus junonius TaxID=109634 RepID=A0A9P5TFJ0_GYMJU|nr:hypothetical protein CPB84DRAFT_1853572 [Gymnopilus junonius]
MSAFILTSGTDRQSPGDSPIDSPRRRKSFKLQQSPQTQMPPQFTLDLNGWYHPPLAYQMLIHTPRFMIEDFKRDHLRLSAELMTHPFFSYENRANWVVLGTWLDYMMATCNSDSDSSSEAEEDSV